ncbi:MAG: cupin domain-containing protein [Hyphomicrobiaceae bacterium]
MAIQRLTSKDFGVLTNPGVTSTQIVWHKNSPAAQVTITRVTVEPGATQDRHAHDGAEQIWLVEQGNGELLTADGGSEALSEGDVVRTPSGEIHGLKNTGSNDLIYVSVTTPPQDYSNAYGKTENQCSGSNT